MAERVASNRRAYMRLPLAICFLILASVSARAELGFPEYVAFPPQIRLDPDQKLMEDAVGEAEFKVDATGSQTETKRGRRFERWLAYKPSAGEPAPGYDNGTEGRIFDAMTAKLTARGWQLVFAQDEKSSFSMHRQVGGGDSWLAVRMDAPQAQVHVEVVELGSVSPGLTLRPPAAKPETIADTADLPYLPPPPGSTRTGEGRGDGPLDVTRPGSGDEPALVGKRVVTRSYQAPRTLSKLQFIGDYRTALLKAGWQVLYPSDENSVRDYGSLAAHYARDGRDIWVLVSYEFSGSLTFTTTDVGAEDWAATFAKECRVPLYGVFFDFNKAVIKAESDAVLQKTAALLASAPKAKAEIQGHTDNVGGEDYNLKLSDARAASVRAWLTQHGIEATRLTSKGYGKTRPVATNDTDQGRARNRRVELVNLGCAH